MTPSSSEALAPSAEPVPPEVAVKRPVRAPSIQPVLEKLFELYPHLFGAEFLPLKLGIFQELLAAHPEDFTRDALKAALGVHTRSTRYLQGVAAGKKRHDLAGVAVESVAPEHVCLALLELFRRKQGRTQEDLQPKFRAQLVRAFEASGLTPQEYRAKVVTSDAAANALLEQAFADYDEQRARQEALCRALEGSGKTPEEFAEMYGMDKRDVIAALERQRRQQAPAVPS
ncbi:MAG: prop effector [Burkholderiaceae bacterium]|nr:MAG: prop effector [Burkholderiaceae bacterium]